ncbi:hypothetical protein ACIPSJ_27295 [Streptomyces sp. NPDC090088]|uniref:hypothetical protein n=1 Tax=Streptomyces sp. NPDC090088 TaxID=3365944 RepID=UPI0037FF1F56
MSAAEAGSVLAGRLEPVLRRLSDTAAGRTAEARLLALLAVLHPHGQRGFRLTGGDFLFSDAAAAEAAVSDLASSGLLRRADAPSRSSHGAREPVWAVAGTEQSGAGMPGTVLERFVLHMWVSRLVQHELLDGQPAGVRLAALYLTECSLLRGRGQAGLRSLARLCALGPPEAGAETLGSLQAAGWVDALHMNSGWNRPATYRLSETARLLVPGCDPPAAECSVSLAEGSEFALASWVHAFGRRHGHPPSLDGFLAFHNRQSSYRFFGSRELQIMVSALRQKGWVEIHDAAVPTVRPGARYWRHRAASKGNPSKRHALSPRQDAPPSRRTTDSSSRQRQAGLSPHGRGPDLPLTPPRPRTTAQPTVYASAPTASVVPPGIWLLPGARAVLDPDSP